MFKAITPLLNVSNLQQSLPWFEKLAWQKKWDRGEPAGFGAVATGEGEIFLCQGGCGRGDNTTTFGPGGDECADSGSWMSLWVENVDEVYWKAREARIELVFEPNDMPWGVRECHLMHPDGHVFRVSQSLGPA